MKANFALSLSFDGIRLLHRAAGGWRHVGEVDVASETLTQDMAILRKTALELDPSGLASKLILPSGQIKYLTLETGDIAEVDRRIAARKALDGATPYEVDELRFDISEDGDQTHIAAVARETLEEAESFAVDHGFAPLSWVAVPGDATFLGEPFFGATRFSEGFLSEGGEVEKDGVAVVILETVAPPAASNDSDDTVEAESNDTAQPESAELPEPVAALSDIAPETAEPPVPEVPITFRHAAQRDASTTTAFRKTTPAPTTPAKPAAAPSTAVPAAEMPSFSSRRHRAGAPALGGARRNDIPPAVGEATTPVSEPIIEPTPLDEEPETAPPPLPSLRERLLRSPAPAEPEPSRTAPNGTAVPAPETEQARMTIFGARTEASAPKKPRFLGLILSLILLAVLALVGIWAALFLDDGSANLLPPESAPAQVETALLDPELAPEPEPEPEQITAPITLPAPVDTPEQVLAPEAEPETPPETAPVAEPPSAADVEAAIDLALEDPEAFYAVSGIWTVPPHKPETPGFMALDNVYQTAIDPTDLSVDALALLPDRSFDTDTALTAPAAPPPASARFVLDARGLVAPSPEGTMNPEGVLVFAGKPPVLPPRRPAQTAVIPAPANNSALAAFRPRTRPGNLIESNERQQLGGLSRAELAKFRPRLRPRVEKTEEEAAAEADETPTARAVAVSFRPATRPRNFARIVARAQPAPETTTRAIAQVAPRTVKPARPTAGSVTRQATVKNQLNLNKINLIGVYGSPSSRRALVRLSNGRFKKVKVGDRIDGGRVSKIGNSELSYRKGSRNVVLKMPRT